MKTFIALLGLGSIGTFFLGTALAIVFGGWGMGFKVGFASFLIFVFAVGWTMVSEKS